VASLGLAVCLAASACGDSPGELARRILERYRRSAGVKPLPASGVILLHLVSESSPNGASGSCEISWEGDRYRESTTSAGVTIVRGIQAGRSFLTDEDGVTRVGSEPILRELVTRSYFWRRAYLFEDRQRAKVRLGPADDRTVSVDLHPYGGNPLRLKFRRSDGSLAEAESPRFHLELTSPRSFRDLSRPGAALASEIRWQGLPTGTLRDEQTGGGRAVFRQQPGAPIEWTSHGPTFAAKVNGLETRIRLDASIDGPLRLSSELAAKTGLQFQRDVFGREIATGARLELPGVDFPAVTVERVASSPMDTGAAAGGTIFRETVVEIDSAARLLVFHDPESWVAPERLNRLLVDDDGNRPVATLTRNAENVRVALGADTGTAMLLLAVEAGRRIGVEAPGPAVEGFRWGILAQPPMAVALDPEAFSPDWGDDGRLGWEALRRFHFYLDMPHRWVYLKPAP
jgi:hypothetical protein